MLQYSVTTLHKLNVKYYLRRAVICITVIAAMSHKMGVDF